MFCRLKAAVALPANSMEPVPEITPTVFVSCKGVCKALAPEVRLLLLLCKVPPAMLTRLTAVRVPPANGCAALMMTVP